MDCMTLRSAADGWHYGVEYDDPYVDNAGGLLEGPISALIERHDIRHIDLREDVEMPDTLQLIEACGRRLRSAVRYDAPKVTVVEDAPMSTPKGGRNATR